MSTHTKSNDIVSETFLPYAILTTMDGKLSHGYVQKKSWSAR